MSKASDVLKERMSKEEMIAFIKNSELQNGDDWCKFLNGKIISKWSRGFFYGGTSFAWNRSIEGFDYWNGIYERFTEKELDLVINIQYIRDLY